MRNLVCLSDFTSKDGKLERVDDKLYTEEEALAESACEYEYVFMTETEYKKAVSENICR